MAQCFAVTWEGGKSKAIPNLRKYLKKYFIEKLQELSSPCWNIVS